MTEEKIYLRTRIPKHIHKELKKASVDEARTIEDIVANLIEEWLLNRSKTQTEDSSHP